MARSNPTRAPPGIQRWAIARTPRLTLVVSRASAAAHKMGLLHLAKMALYIVSITPVIITARSSWRSPVVSRNPVPRTTIHPWAHQSLRIETSRFRRRQAQSLLWTPKRCRRLQTLPSILKIARITVTTKRSRSKTLFKLIDSIVRQSTSSKRRSQSRPRQLLIMSQQRHPAFMRHQTRLIIIGIKSIRQRTSIRP